MDAMLKLCIRHQLFAGGFFYALLQRAPRPNIALRGEGERAFFTHIPVREITATMEAVLMSLVITSSMKRNTSPP